MKRIFSIIMESGLGLPTGTIAFWGTLVPRILTVDHTFKRALDLLKRDDLQTTTGQLILYPLQSFNVPVRKIAQKEIAIVKMTSN